MTSAYVLILAILVLGGLLATMGDRLGTKVGKARLSLFGLRPRQTATVVTIVTGLTIAASTLSILFATSKSLRIGVFQLDEKLKQLRDARKELVSVVAQKQQVEAELVKAREQQIRAQQQLNAINQSLQTAIERQTRTEAQLNATETELDVTQNELTQIQSDFQRAKTELGSIETKFDRAQTQLKQVSQQAQTLRREIEQLQAERQQLIEKEAQVRALIGQRDRELVEQKQQLEEQKQALARQKSQVDEQRLLLDRQREQIVLQEEEIALQTQEISEQAQQMVEQEREIAVQKQEIARQKEEVGFQAQQIDRQESEIALQEQEIAKRDREIAEREMAISDQQKLLKELATQQTFLQREVQSLERDFQLLREGTVAIRRNQVLASGVVRVLKPYGARQAAEELLKEANLAALKLIRPGTNQDNEPAIAITDAEIEQLIDQIDDGQDYVVRILSAANYLLGERQVSVFADAVVNDVVFEPGEVVATTSVTPSKMMEEEIQERMSLLLAAANFRARRSGLVADSLQIGDGRFAEVMEFIQNLPNSDEPAIVQAIAAQRTYTAGPLTIEFVVVQKGQSIFRTD